MMRSFPAAGDSMRNRVVQLSAMALLLVLLSPSYAWAYIDPSIGSYVFQLLIAGGLAAAFTLRRYSHALMTFVRARFGRSDDGKAARDRDGVE
jgi:hypothetical protein